TLRESGATPYTLIDFFPDDFLIVIDESHATLPQIRGMYNGDRARKQMLVDHGFRLPSALDNRPLKFDEFEEKENQLIYVSATPGPYELEHTPDMIEQIIRPTWLLDPEIEIRPVEGQIDDLLAEINKRSVKNERVLITTLTKRMSEDLTDYFKELGIKVAYLHSEIKTLERIEIIRDLRLKKYDVLIGINLLREGLDIPEVSLIQTMGRAARNEQGRVIMYADKITDSMQVAIDETNRRRNIQEAYNIEHNQTPTTIKKDVRGLIQATVLSEDDEAELDQISKIAKMPKAEKMETIEQLEEEMRAAAKELDFERATELRDIIFELKVTI